MSDRNNADDKETETGREAGDERNAGNAWNDDGDPLAWETLDSTVAYTCPGFDVRHETVRLPDDTETDFDYLAEPPAVVVLPFTSEGRVVLIEEWRQAVGRVNRGLPAGTVEREDTDLETAARRELREETGYETEDVSPVVTVEPVNGVADSVHHYFLAENCEPMSEQDLDADESIRVITEEYEAFCDTVRANEVRDGRAVLALAFYELARGQ
jgi:ADP-ribose pyrophosphatase